MDWSKYNIIDTTDKIIKKSEGLEDLTNYKLITRYNLDELKNGMHIKYSRTVYDLESGKTFEKLYNGGFLLGVIERDKPVFTKLILKTNIIWKLFFLNNKIYAKDQSDFYRSSSLNVKNALYNKYKDEIEQKKSERDKQMREKLNQIKKGKNKYNIFFD